MSHVTHMTESCHTYAWVLSHLWMSHCIHTATHIAVCCSVYAMWSVCKRDLYTWREYIDNLNVQTSEAYKNRALSSKKTRILQDTHTHMNEWHMTRCNRLHHTATHCNTLQHTVTHCDTLQHAETHCITVHHSASHCNTLQHTTTHCNTHTTTPNGTWPVSTCRRGYRAFLIGFWSAQECRNRTPNATNWSPALFKGTWLVQ